MKLHPKTEELLYFLLWNVHKLLRPTFRNLTDSFESWAYQEGFQHQLWNLERKQLLERQTVSTGQTLHRLTERGRLQALGGRDPAAAWDRPWDGQWRLVVFDLPEQQNATRTRLRRFLRAHGFGYLQKSVWITPHPLAGIMHEWPGAKKDVESLITFTARPGATESDADIVAGAWDFERINRLYESCLAVLDELPERTARWSGAEPLCRWARSERAAWLEAIMTDPLLPTVLLPKGYLGKRVWERRREVLACAARLVE